MSQVSDYNIANASGASVRSDLNAVFDAIKTLNSGGSDPSNTEAFMPYVDTADSNNFKIRNAANNGFTTVGSVDSPNLGLLPVAGGTMTGQLLADDSSGASSPALSFDGDTDTGIYRSTANTMGFSTAGTQRVGISNAGLDMLNALPIRFQDSSGSPFVSLQSPSSLSGNVALTLPSSITNGGFLQTDGSGNLSFSIVEGVPTGSVFAFVGSTAPTGYLKANGDTIPNGSGTVQGVTANFAALYALVGATLPDLRGEFVRGFDDGRGVDSGRSINSSQGGENATHNHAASSSVSESSHTHNQRGLALSGGSGSVAITLGSGQSYQIGYSGSISSRSTGSATTGISVSTTTSNQGSEARPRNIAMMYIIKI